MRVDVGKDSLGFQTGVLSQSARNHLKRGAKLLDGVLIETWLLLCKLLDLLSEPELSGTSTCDTPWVLDECLHSADSVINGALSVFEHGIRGATEHDSRHFVLVFVTAEDCAPCGGNFLKADLICETQLVRGWSHKFNDWSGTDSPCDALQLPLAHDFHGVDLILLEIVDGKTAFKDIIGKNGLSLQCHVILVVNTVFHYFS